jgi:hypothetical protein
MIFRWSLECSNVSPVPSLRILRPCAQNDGKLVSMHYAPNALNASE